MTNVIKIQFRREWDDNRPGGREYTYYTPEPVNVGDSVDIETDRGVVQGVVSQIDVPVAEIARFGNRAKSVMGKTVFAQGVVITPEGVASAQEFTSPLYKTVGAAVGGYIQIVVPRGLPDPFVMIVNEEGRLKNLPYNAVASGWYGTESHGQPIVGTVVVMKQVLNAEEEPDLAGLTEREIADVKERVEAAKASGLPEEPENSPPVTRGYSFDSEDDFWRFMNRIER